MNSVLIAPSILSADFSRLAEELKSVESADWVHVDVMDGHFVPNLTIGPVVVHWLRRATAKFLDVHLMITDPMTYAEPFLDAGSDGLTFHIEACPNPQELISLIKKRGKKAAVSIRPKTPWTSLEPILKDVDMVLVMSVEPGFGGQKFMPEMLEKIKALKAWREQNGAHFLIEIDGGINAQTALAAVAAGAQVLVAGNAVFAEKDRAQAIQKIRDSVDKIAPGK